MNQFLPFPANKWTIRCRGIDPVVQRGWCHNCWLKKHFSGNCWIIYSLDLLAIFVITFPPEWYLLRLRYRLTHALVWFFIYFTKLYLMGFFTISELSKDVIKIFTIVDRTLYWIQCLLIKKDISFSFGFLKNINCFLVQINWFIISPTFVVSSKSRRIRSSRNFSPGESWNVYP
jgi:hypothetical protein